MKKSRLKLLQQPCILRPVSTHCSRQAFQLFTSSEGDAPAKETNEPDNGDSSMNVLVDVYKEVQKVIELWVKNVEGNRPTAQQDENLKADVIHLAELVKHEKTKRARLAKDEDLGLDEGNSANCKTIDTNRREDGEADRTTASKPIKLLELAQYILESLDDDKLRELKFQISLWDPTFMYTGGGFHFQSRDQFQAALNDIQNDRIKLIEFAGDMYGINKIQAAYVDLQALMSPPNNLVDRINKLAGTFATLQGGVLKWDESLVEPTDKDDLRHIAFCSDYSKGSAIVVSGESGSGKTWFSQKYIPNRLEKQDLALIYCSVQDKDGHERIRSDDSLKSYTMACGKGMRYLRDTNHRDSEVYRCLSDLSMEYNKDRDNMAHDWLITKIEEVLKQDDIVNEWWNVQGRSKFKPLEKLVFVVDEVGKNPELARGLISIVRRLYRDVQMNKAHRVLLVLAGSGLDRHISYDTVPHMADEETQQTTAASFGTDPPQANIIKLRGPDLNRNEINGIPTNTILKGTYSRVLATNTRMLTRGVLPMMAIPELTEYVLDEKKSERYVALGSTDIVMDYAARKYTALNGLGQMPPQSVAVTLLRQFKLLHWERLMYIKDSNPAYVKMLVDLNVKMPSDLDEILALGLVTSDIKSTSSALRYLACNGNTAPLDGQDGIGFETMLQYHLVRLCDAYNSSCLNNDSSQDRGTHWVGRYDLRQAWPPSSSKLDTDLTDFAVTLDEVEKGYKTHNDDDGNESDISTIMSLLNKIDYDFDLGLRQTVTNAQGADVMILSRKAGKVVLHLFQCQDRNDIPGVNSRRLGQFFWSLGVKIGKGGKDINIEPDYGSAGYSYLGTQQFAKKLGEKLGTPVNIGHRILVFSKEWNGELTRDFLRKAEEKGVMVWTREMLEPTISALYTPTGSNRNYQWRRKRKNKAISQSND